jgi:biotin synthase
MERIVEILNKSQFTKTDIVTLLKANKEDSQKIFDFAYNVKAKHVGRYVYFRGLVEFSNTCSKDCMYCGIRKSNKNCSRYFLTDEEIMEGIKYSYENNFGSVVLQSGERTDEYFVERVDQILKKITKFSNGELGVTLSCGEQTEDTYKRWRESGAHRYLLRIESSNRHLYYQIHPKDSKHDYDERLNSLKLLRKTGYQVGTGVMIGLPFQTINDLADDLLFMQKIDVDMVGMGPYLEHENTPLYQYKDQLIPIAERFQVTLKMIALLRIMMKDINIASSTALQAVDPKGREQGLRAGANVIMPNVTPLKYHQDYYLYNNKPTVNEETTEYVEDLIKNIDDAGDEIRFNLRGDSKHFHNRSKKQN